MPHTVLTVIQTMRLPVTLRSLALLLSGGGRAVGWLVHLGLLGLFLVSIVDSSFVPMPIPGLTDIMVIGYAASHANVFLIVAIATLGSAAGGLFSYQVGQAGGKAFLEKHVNQKLLDRVTRWMERHAIISVALPALLPPPMPLSPFVLVAGASCMSRRKFMTAFTLSRLLRHALAAWLGVYYGPAVLRFWQSISQRYGTLILIVFWAVVLIPTAFGIWKLYRTSKDLNLRGGKAGKSGTNSQTSHFTNSHEKAA